MMPSLGGRRTVAVTRRGPAPAAAAARRSLAGCGPGATLTGQRPARRQCRSGAAAAAAAAA